MKRARVRMAGCGCGLVLLCGAAAAQGDPIQPGQVIYDFDTSTNPCYPEDWTFFGHPQTDFGFDADAEDGAGAFQAVDWSGCDFAGLPQCVWAGSAVGVGVFSHEHCTPGGVDDANLDLSLGTGLTLRVKDNLTVGFGGTAGARLQLQLVDIDGTTAVTPRVILQNPDVNRMPLLADDWETLRFFFAGLDWAWDNDDAVAGAVPGLDLTHIKEIKLLWRRSGAEGVNVFEFDELTLIDTPPSPWADTDADGDVDLRDSAALQGCFGGSPEGDCTSLDADRDGDIDIGDFAVWSDVMLGPDVTSGFFAWAY